MSRVIFTHPLRLEGTKKDHLAHPATIVNPHREELSLLKNSAVRLQLTPPFPTHICFLVLGFGS
jgi:hypothetical protein